MSFNSTGIFSSAWSFTNVDVGFESFVDGNAIDADVDVVAVVIVAFVVVVVVVVAAEGSLLEDDCGGAATAVVVVVTVLDGDSFGGSEGFGTKYSSGTNFGNRKQNFTLLSNISSTIRCTLDPR